MALLYRYGLNGVIERLSADGMSLSKPRLTTRRLRL